MNVVAAKSPATSAGNRELVVARSFDATRELVESLERSRADGDLVGAERFHPSDLRDGCASGRRHLDRGDRAGRHVLPDGRRVPRSLGARAPRVHCNRVSGRRRPALPGPIQIATATFTAQGNKTMVVVHAVVVRATPAMAGALSGMEQGWNESLDRLDEVVKR